MNDEGKESIFLNEYLMLASCIFAAGTSFVTAILIRSQGNPFAMFEVIVKMVTVIMMYLAYKKFSWDVAKGIMGGVLFCLMYQEAHMVLEHLWGEEDFDAYLVVGVQGSIYLAAAGMSFLMTIIITLNHFIINYGKNGNPGNVILNRMAIIYKIILYIVLLITNSRLGFGKVFIWENGFQYLTDIAIFLLIVSIESQLDSFKVLRQELLREKRKKAVQSKESGIFIEKAKNR
ncbi:hypothetical protein [Butyrivibrio sp. AC2005]|uniref:hypothetical protein n=1 Tax=Butyrivibrio sp. AC2005 TaxID=1280672 RepID=UPI00047D0284|nr:hypothetical protein [Butyrivibrio sp. AC2005]